MLNTLFFRSKPRTLFKPDELGGELLDLVLLHAGVLLQGTVLLQDTQEPANNIQLL